MGQLDGPWCDNQLSSCVCRKAEKLGAKQAGMKSDDWSKVYLYMGHLAKAEGEICRIAHFKLKHLQLLLVGGLEALS
jgi:hypothetical protein